MSKLDVIRAWKDAEYRSSLTASQRAMLPESPAGALDLSDSDLDLVAGGTDMILPFPGSNWFPGCPTGDFVPCPSQFFCPQTFGSDICPILY
jgi:mersacidin/lichenicidin family type 2 lantibiotic